MLPTGLIKVAWKLLQALLQAKRRNWWQDLHSAGSTFPQGSPQLGNNIFHQALKSLPILLCRPHSQGQECEVVKGLGCCTCCPPASQLHPKTR